MGRRARAVEDIEAYRDRIVEVATGLFAKRGYAGVTFRSLAEGLGCSAMTPYRYFTDKDEIFAAVRRRAYDDFAEVQEAAAAAPGDPYERLASIGRAYIRFGVERTDAYRLMFSLAQPNPSTYQDLRSAELRAWNPLYDAICTAIDAGVLAGEPNILANVFWSGVHGLVSLHVAGKLVYGPDIERLIEPVLRALFVGNQPRALGSPNHPGEQI
jgi:AcrR family transcriptional regulator